MTRIIEKTLYQFDELSDSAKETARDWFRGCVDGDEIAEMGDDLDTIATILGVEFDTRSVSLMGGGTRSENCIYWSLYPSWCAFEGRYAYAKGAPKAIRAHAPNDVELHRIADELQALQRVNFYRLTAVCAERREWMSVDVDDGLYGARGADELAELLRDFATWIVRQYEANNEYLMSAENVDENILCNGYEFDENGNIV